MLTRLKRNAEKLFRPKLDRERFSEYFVRYSERVYIVFMPTGPEKLFAISKVR